MKIDKPKLKFYIFLFVFLAVIVVSFILHLRGFNLDLHKYLIRLQSSPFLPIVYLALYFLASFFPIPFITFLGATIFPFYEVFLLSLIGNIIFMVIMFYLTRWFTKDYVKRYEKSHSKLEEIDLNINKHAFLYVFLLRLFFIIPPEAVNILGGLSNMSFKKYISASILGTIPVILISIFLVEGYKMKDLSLLIICAVLAVLFIVIPLLFIKGLRKYFKRDKKK